MDPANRGGPFSGQLTLPALAAFANHPFAPLYESVCVRYGVDPAGFLDDPYLAWQLRLALFWATRSSRDPDAPDEQERAMTDRMAEALDV